MGQYSLLLAFWLSFSLAASTIAEESLPAVMVSLLQQLAIIRWLLLEREALSALFRSSCSCYFSPQEWQKEKELYESYIILIAMGFIFHAKGLFFREHSFFSNSSTPLEKKLLLMGSCKSLFSRHWTLLPAAQIEQTTKGLFRGNSWFVFC